jgi:polysaccharide chain length determinant protein (PEP-CTERM system associated)
MISLMDEIKIALHGIWQRRWLAMAVAWGLCLLGWLIVSVIPNSYESRARMLIDVSNVLPSDGNPPVDVRQRLDELRQTINSARNMEQVALQAGIIDRTASDQVRAEAARSLQEAVKVTATQDNIFELVATVGGGGRSDADNAQLATRVIESTIAVFQDERIRGGAESTQQGIRFLDRQIAETETKMRQAETVRAQFEGRNFGLLPGSGSASSRLSAARAELSQVETQLVSAQSALSAINAQIGATPPTVAGPGIGATGASIARQQLGSAQAELASMRARGLTAVHPDVMALEAQISALRAQVAREPNGAGGGAQQNPAYASLLAIRAERQGQVTALQSRRAQLSGEISSMTAGQSREPAIAAEYERLNREFNVQKDLYDRLVARRERLRLEGEEITSGESFSVRILDTPTRPTTPSEPNRPLLLLGVLFAGLAGGVGTALALSQLQTTYPTAARLAKASGLPVIGSVTEILTDELRAARSAKLRRFAMAGGGLVGLCSLLLAVEFIRRGMVG